MKFKIILFLALSFLTCSGIKAQHVWTPSTDGLGSGKQPEAMASLPNGDVIIFMDTYPGSPVAPDFFKSTDQGITWVALNASGFSNIDDVLKLKSTSSGLILIGKNLNNESFMYKSLDDGENWSLCTSGISNSHTVYDVVEISSNHWLATASTNNWDHKMYKSTNQGDYWSEVQVSGNDSISGVFGMYYFDDKVYITALKSYRNHNGLSVFESDDNGQSWNFQFDMPNIRVVNSIIETSDAELFMVGKLVNSNSRPSLIEVFRSSNYGESWDTISTTGLEDRGYVTGIALTGGTLLLSGGAQQHGLANTFMFSSPLAPVSVNEKYIQNFNVYPNPFTDKLFVDNPENKEVVITNITGQVVLKSRGEVIVTSTLPKGIYVVTCSDKEPQIVIK